MARTTRQAILAGRRVGMIRLGAVLTALLAGGSHLGFCMAADTTLLKVSMPWGGAEAKGQDRRMHISLDIGDVQSSVCRLDAADACRDGRMISLDLTNLQSLYLTARHQSATQDLNMSAGGKVVVGVGVAAAVFIGAYVFVINQYDDAAKQPIAKDRAMSSLRPPRPELF